MRELEDQKMLMQTVFSPETETDPGLTIQKSLVLHRFHEVISHAFPLWYARVEEDAFVASLYAFMQQGAQSPQIWKTPDAYRKFIHTEQLFRQMPYVDDLLWFEWIEVALIMRYYSPVEVSTFSYDKAYRLSESGVLKNLNFKVFETDGIEQSGTYHLLAYYDFDTDSVFFREISEVLMLFLDTLDHSSLTEAITAIAELSESTEAEVMVFFEDTLRELLALRVIEER
jgi:hypothetical protein